MIEFKNITKHFLTKKNSVHAGRWSADCGTDCEKWDEQALSFGEEGLQAMWVADMDFKVPACVQKALHEYVDMGAFGYMSIRDNYYQAFINWEKNEYWDIYTNGIRVLFGNAFGYVACEAAYEGGEEWYQDVKKQIWSNYEYLKHTFAEKLPGAVVSPLEGTYLCWIDLRACIDPEKTKELIQKRCRLAVDFGEWFGGDQFKGFIRMNLATSLKNVQIAVEAICKNV